MDVVQFYCMSVPHSYATGETSLLDKRTFRFEAFIAEIAIIQLDEYAFTFMCSQMQGLMLLLQNLPTQNWESSEISLIVAEAYRLKYTYDNTHWR